MADLEVQVNYPNKPSNKGGIWEYLIKLSVIAIPFVIAYGGWQIQKSLQDQSIRRDYVQLAVSILKDTDTTSENLQLRNWAVELLNKNSPVPLNDTFKQQLKSGRISLPSIDIKPQRIVKLETPPMQDLGNCQIQKFFYKRSLTQISFDSIEFNYNLLGNPTSAIRSNAGTGEPNFLFRYDKKNRMTELIGAFNLSDLKEIENWHKYFYDRLNHIVVDSTYYFPEIINGKPTTNKIFSVTYYNYDNKNRIIKATTITDGRKRIIN